MIRLAGRYNVDLDVAWALTPGEFEDYVAGRMEAEREMRYGFALVYSAVAGLGGQRVSPLYMIGEEEEYGEDPFPDLTPVQKHERAKRLMREAALRKAKEDYLPDGYDEE